MPSYGSIVQEQMGTTMDADVKATGPELATEADRWELSDDALRRRAGEQGVRGSIGGTCSVHICGIIPAPTKQGIVVDIE